MRTCTREVEESLRSRSHFHYRNGTELANEIVNETVNPASEQNHMGPPGFFVTSLESSGSVEPAGSKPGLFI